MQTYSSVFRHIKTYLDIIRHIQAYPGIIQKYSEPCVTLSYPELWDIQNQRHIQKSGISKTLTHSEPETYLEFWVIQNSGIFRTEGILESRQRSTMGHIEKQLTRIIIFASYNHFHSISFSCPLVLETNMIFFNASLFFTPEVFIQCKKV